MTIIMFILIIRFPDLIYRPNQTPIITPATCEAYLSRDLQGCRTNYPDGGAGYEACRTVAYAAWNACYEGIE